MHGWTWKRLQHLIRAEMRHLTTVSPSERRWQRPLAAALATGLPLLVGAYPVLAFIALLVFMVCRFYRVGPPGTIFLFYSVFTLRTQAPQPVAPLPPATFDFVVFDSVVIGLFVGLSLALAQLLDLQRAYWVPVSCLAVIQGVSFRAVWNKQLQRIVGTVLGLLLFLGLLALPLDKWTISLLVMALSFIVEVMIVRHYGLAVIFITPLTLFLAEAATLGHGVPTGILQAQLVDTIVGSLVGLVGDFCLHSPRFREVAGWQLKRLTPSRLLP